MWTYRFLRGQRIGWSLHIIGGDASDRGSVPLCVCLCADWGTDGGARTRVSLVLLVPLPQAVHEARTTALEVALSQSEQRWASGVRGRVWGD